MSDKSASRILKISGLKTATGGLYRLCRHKLRQLNLIKKGQVQQLDYDLSLEENLTRDLQDREGRSEEFWLLQTYQFLEKALLANIEQVQKVEGEEIRRINLKKRFPHLQ
ncbi:MAG: hypothetical protein KDK41_09345 [Leptospiraceae bacterium]|nr:hypothetical protein [Leptospiraceae bacterium]